MMTLQEAIRHCEETADSCTDECGAEHRQLAEWLQELQDRREAEPGRLTDDPISRHMAITAANRADYTGLAVEDVKKVTDEVVKELKRLPSVQKIGRWMENKTGCAYWICSCCGFSSEAFAANMLYQYCPHCGARMEDSNG